LFRETANTIGYNPAKVRIKDVIHGLHYGADDYVTKPFNPGVLVARAKSVLLWGALTSGLEKFTAYSDNYLTINLDRHQVLIAIWKE